MKPIHEITFRTMKLIIAPHAHYSNDSRVLFLSLFLIVILITVITGLTIKDCPVPVCECLGQLTERSLAESGQCITIIHFSIHTKTY